MAGNHTRKYKAKQRKKIKKAILSTVLSLILILLIMLGGGSCVYESNEQFREIIDSNEFLSDVYSQVGDIMDLLGLNPSAVPQKPFIDPNGEEMALHFIDVGQGDSALLQTPKGSVLIDCGEKEYGDTVVSYLKAQGVTELEYFIITHPDSDHMGSASYVLENIKVNNFVINGLEKSAKFFESALDVIESKDVPSYIATDGDVFIIGSLRLEILGPCVDDVSELESNDSSLIIRATYGSNSFLFTGDAEKEGEALLLKHHKNEIDCDIFSAGHHGAKTSNSLDLLEAATPEFVVVSCGKDNSYGHPTSYAMNNFAAVGATVYRTDELGSIVFITDGNILQRK